MANLVEVNEMLKDRKLQLIKILDEFIKLEIECHNNLLDGRFKDLGMTVANIPSQDDPMGKAESGVIFQGRTPRLIRIFRKQEGLEGHDSKLDKSLLRAASYEVLTERIKVLYDRDLRHLIRDSSDFGNLIVKIDSYKFTTHELAAISHLLAFEPVKEVPKYFEGTAPSYLSALHLMVSLIKSRDYDEDNRDAHEYLDIFGYKLAILSVNLDYFSKK